MAFWLLRILQINNRYIITWNLALDNKLVQGFIFEKISKKCIDKYPCHKYNNNDKNTCQEDER